MEFVAQLKELPPNGPVMQGIQCFFKYGVTPLLYIASLYIWVGRQLYTLYTVLPVNVVELLFGVALCFFGGVYFAGIAAWEAARIAGGIELWEHLQTCWEEGSRIRDAHLLDDQERGVGSSAAGGAEMSGADLVRRKTMVALIAVKDPHRLQQALFSLVNIYIAVIATLKFQFARTVAVAVGIASMLTLPTTRLLGPSMATVMGPELSHWVPAIIDTAIKIVAIFVASYIQACLGAAYSGLRGGRLVAGNLFSVAAERGWLDALPDCLVAKPFDPNQSYLDEVVAYPLAAVGVYIQLTSGFALPFPWNLLLLPLSTMENLLRWQVYT